LSGPVAVSDTDLDRIISRYEGKEHFLIPVLQDIQEQFGYIPPELLGKVAERLGIPLTQVYAVATFYRAFSLAPRGKHIVRICDGTACHVKGSQVLADVARQETGVSSGETSQDGMFTLERVNCLGACALAPVVVVNEKYYERMTPERLRKVLRGYKNGEEGAGEAEE